MESVRDLIDRHRNIAIDSNILIYLFEGSGHDADRASEIIDAIASGVVRGSLATIGLSEVLTRPARLGHGSLLERYAEEIRSIEHLRLVALSAEIAIDAAWVRGGGGMRLPDAVHLASAVADGATAFITNDRRLRSTPRLEIVSLADLTAS